MVIRIEPASPDLLEGLPAFAAQVWSFPPGQKFLDWYFGSPGTRLFVAHDDGEWLAGIGLTDRDYCIGGGRIPCYETYAWASLQNQRSRGLGIKTLKEAMSGGRPLIALGGSDFTEDFMPRLGFSTVAQAPSMILPLRGGSVRGGGWKNAVLRSAVDIAGQLLVPSPNDRVRAVPVARLSEAMLAFDGLPGFHACPSAAYLAWLSDMPSIGNFLPLVFLSREDEPVGWCFARIAEEDAPGELVARILETKFFPASDVQDRNAMMQIAVRVLARLGVNCVRALTTCPDTISALRKLHFREGRLNPAMVFLNGLDLGDAPPRISVFRGDGGALPVPYSARNDAL